MLMRDLGMYYSLRGSNISINSGTSPTHIASLSMRETLYGRRYSLKNGSEDQGKTICCVKSTNSQTRTRRTKVLEINGSGTYFSHWELILELFCTHHNETLKSELEQGSLLRRFRLVNNMMIMTSYKFFLFYIFLLFTSDSR